jgi:iron complex outermembrane receptor protein
MHAPIRLYRVGNARGLAFRAAVLSALLALTHLGQRAYSEPADAAGAPVETDLTEITVIAEKRSERAVDVPASLTVLKGDDLPVGGGATNAELTYYVPGLTMDRTGTNEYPAVRGVSSLVSGPGLDANVATYIDGVYITDAAVLIDLPDVKTIDVLKGPQGTLFGRNATGGAIQITTLNPSFTPTGQASFSYGRFNDQLFKGFLSGPIIADKLAGSISLYEESNDGYLNDLISGDKTGGLHAQLVRGKLLFTPNEDASFILSSYYSRHNDPAGAYGTPVGGTAAYLQPGAIVPRRPWDVAVNAPAQDISDGRGVSLNGSVHLNAGTLSIIGSYDRSFVKFIETAYFAYAPAGGAFINEYGPDESQSFEVNFASKRFGKFNYITGLYFFHDRAAYNPVQIIDDIPPLALSIFGYESDYSYAAFGESNFSIIDALTATVGVRFSSEHRFISGVGVLGEYLSPPVSGQDYGSVAFSSWTPRFSLRYAVNASTNAYFTYSQGFKSGGYDPAQVFGNTPPLNPVKPEQLTAYELGMKSSPAPGINLSGSVYYYDYKNQQVSSFANKGGAAVSETLNAAASTIYGADFEATARVNSALNVRSGISLLHARFENFPTAVVNIPNYQTINGEVVSIGNNQVNQNVKGNALPRAPDWTISIGATYVKNFAAGTWTTKADLFRSDKFFYDSGNIYKQRGYSKLDAATSWQLPRSNWTFTLWGKNLTDSATTIGSFLTAQAGAYYWAPPRTFGGAISTKF